MSGGYEYKVIGEVIPDLYCCVCLNLMKEAMQFARGHGMCYSCLQDLELKNKKDFICPSCRQKIDNIQPATIINRINMSVKVKCGYFERGCSWTGELSNIQDHLTKECHFQLVNCTFDNCKEAMERHRLPDHQELCTFKTVLCMYCSSTCLMSELKDHCATCGKYPVPCSNQCSMETMEREMVEVRRNICCKEVVACEFSSFRCNSTFTRDYMLDYGRSLSQHHLSLTLKEVQEMKDNIVKFMQGMKKEINDLKLQASEKEKAKLKWYTAKLFVNIKNELNENDIFSNHFMKLFKAHLKAFDSNFDLFIKSIAWLKNHLNETIKCRNHTEGYQDLQNEVFKIFEKNILIIKEDILLLNSIWETIKHEMKTFIADLQKGQDPEQFLLY